MAAVSSWGREILSLITRLIRACVELLFWWVDQLRSVFFICKIIFCFRFESSVTVVDSYLTCFWWSKWKRMIDRIYSFRLFYFPLCIVTCAHVQTVVRHYQDDIVPIPQQNTPWKIVHDCCVSRVFPNIQERRPWYAYRVIFIFHVIRNFPTYISATI